MLVTRRYAPCLGRNACMKKKRHHFIPIVYLKSFCDDEGKVFVYRKDDPKNPFHQKPDKTGFHKYYYSQPIPEGGMNHDALENFFSEIESPWPSIVELIQQSKYVDGNKRGALFDFLLLQYIRVPANRDFFENICAAGAKAIMRQLDTVGKLPALPKGLEDYLEHVEIAVDPHRSILAMPSIVSAIEEKILRRLGFGVIHNKTDVPFLTSDNPVIWFDPSVPEEEIQPYGIRPNGPVMLLFPVSPNLMIIGKSSLNEKFIRYGIGYAECRNSELAKKYNHYICQFAYETVFARERGQETIIEEHAHLSPVLETSEIPQENERIVIIRPIFGQRNRKPAWNKKT